MKPLKITTRSFLKLIASYPNPDGPDGDWGPLGPYVRPPAWATSLLLQPWLQGPFPQPWHSGPLPDPWKNRQPPYRATGAVLAHTVVAASLERLKAAEVAGVPAEKAVGAVRRQFWQFVDELCPPLRKLPPLPPKKGWPPFPPPPWPPEPWDRLTAALEFSRAAESLADHSLKADFEEAADKIVEITVQQLTG